MPYNQQFENMGGEAGQAMLRDFVQGLEEARKPRVITLAEMQELPDLMPIYIEHGNGHISGPMLAVNAKRGYNLPSMRMGYNKIMRYWAGNCPTREQMASVPWEIGK